MDDDDTTTKRLSHVLRIVAYLILVLVRIGHLHFII